MAQAAESLPVLRVKDVGWDIEENRILHGVNLVLRPGEIFVIMGPNGCGKTTLLKLLCGLILPTRGIAQFRTTSGAYEDVHCALVDGRMRSAFVFADGGLISNLSVFDNVALPLRYAVALEERQCRDRVRRVLGELGLADCADLRPVALSPGLVKRAQMARAILAMPDIVFYDDPASGLDARQLSAMQQSILHLHHQAQRVSVVATASPRWEWDVADRFAFLHDGSVKAVGTRRELLENPLPALREFLKDVAHADGI